MNRIRNLSCKQVNIPKDLQLIQEWFASVITTPLAKNDTIHYKTKKGDLISEEAKNYIAPSPKLLPHQCIQIYNQQYWWRLINILYTNFPLLVRLTGCKIFKEKIAIPYLSECPPNHWALSLVGERLPDWISKNYKRPDYSLIEQAVQLDWAFTASWIASKHIPLNLSELTKQNPEEILTKTLFLQPHIHLFNWNVNLFLFREELIKQDIHYWTNHRIPLLKKEEIHYYVLYRTEKNILAWREVLEGEFYLLQLLQQGISLEKACEKIEQQSTKLYEQACNHLQKWIQNWAQQHWLIEK
ncbi:Uncharacterized protein PRO82_002084 [Candidatus Protochlamydia amoebophila]|uniref:HvfC/BufC family peptide modification chaperone n=1 Tax=Candidatus Protochlamydia amoebophila TaxID=362787 RepID=UPI001BC9E6D1|nr:putative DNA-binding domain-containing protein [Candidatus Protochlamydia amoebophila]MBS4164751.1 Uncharacterized protein [Candidatus Protochlamydia amoebophila]